MVIRGLPDGGAVATSAGPSQMCGRTPCPGWSIHALGADGTHRTRTEGLLGGSRLPGVLTRTRTGLVGLVVGGPDEASTQLRSVAGPRSAADGIYLGARGASLAFDGARLLMFAYGANDRLVENFRVTDMQPRVAVWGEEARTTPAQGAWESHHA